MNLFFSFSDGESLERRPEEKSPYLQTGNHSIKITITNKSSLFTLKVKFSFVNFNSCFGNELIYLSVFAFLGILTPARNVVIFFQVTAGTIEEKIFQRQLTKQGLGGGILDPERSGGSQQFHFSSGKSDLLSKTS
jgi:hypothetical protein